MNRNRLFILILGIIVFVGVFIISNLNIVLSSDPRINSLLLNILPRAIIALYLAFIIVTYKEYYKFRFTTTNLLWCLPCLLVAIVNFPISSLIMGTSQITYAYVIPLLLLDCVLTALIEEYIFRLILYPVFKGVFSKSRYKVIFASLVSSGIFALLHVTNLFMGANIVSTLLQIGYTFLIGCMFCICYEKTRNYWVIVIIHTLFNFGGSIITFCGQGNFQDTIFWILTVVAGLLCLGHIVYTVIKDIKKDYYN